MKATIKKVATDIKTEKDGNIRMVNLITLSNDTVIVRDTKQFDADLKGSHLTKRQVKQLKGGTVEGDFKFHKAGQPYVTEEYTDRNGDVVPSKEGVYLKDGYRVEGFLDLELNADALDRIENAFAYAELRVSVVATETISDSSSDNQDEIAAMKAELEALKAGANPQVGSKAKKEKV